MLEGKEMVHYNNINLVFNTIFVVDNLNPSSYDMSIPF